MRRLAAPAPTWAIALALLAAPGCGACGQSRLAVPSRASRVPSPDAGVRDPSARPTLPPMKDPKLPGVDGADAALDAKLRAAARAWRGDETPRTRHLDAEGRPLYVNRLALEASPYLRQHAHNPVNWFPWGEEAFARARALDRPIFLSVGYATCHWCHVMEEESFEDPAIAAFLNAHFVAIKVDREERPDVDATYMAAVQALRGQGGWPMTVILTPERRPFFAATYLPPRAGVRGARVGLEEILERLATEYEERREEVQKSAGEITEHLVAQSRPHPPAEVPGPATLRSSAARIALSLDPVHGGFGHAPKFPRPVTLDLLLRVHRRTGEARLLEAVTTTLRGMARGGLFDQLGGGFHRYSTDARWRVPHFEKMLYDNALLASIYVDAWQVTGDDALRRVAERTLDYLLREMRAPEGAFYAATDADSRGAGGELEEGAFFTWTPQEARALLSPEEAAVALSFFGITEAGDLDGRSVLHRETSVEALAESLGVAPSVVTRRVESARKKLLAARARRSPPLRDEKILVEWNGLALSALARAGLALDEPGYLDAARKAASFLLAAARPGGELRHAIVGGRPGGPAFLEDYAALALGLLDLFEATGEVRWLQAARALADELAGGGFWDEENGGYFRTGTAHEALITREKPDYDGALPSGNALAAHLHLRLAVLGASSAQRERADGILSAMARLLERAGGAVPHLLAALERRLDRSVEIVLVRPEGDPGDALLEVVRRTYLPNRALMIVPAEAIDERAATLPLVADKEARRGRATAYVCHEGACKLPTSDPEVLERQLAEIAPLEAR